MTEDELGQLLAVAWERPLLDAQTVRKDRGRPNGMPTYGRTREKAGCHVMTIGPPKWALLDLNQ